MGWIDRQRHFLDYTLSSLLRRKGKNAALVLVYALVVFMVASVIFYAGAIRKEAEAVLQGSPDMVVQRVMAGRHDLIPIRYMEQIKGIHGVGAVSPRLWGYYYHPASRANYTMMVPPEFGHGEDCAEVGPGVMRTWGTMEEDRLYFRAHDGQALALRVVEVLDPSTELLSSDLVLMSERTFRAMTGVPEGQATDLAVTIRNQKEAPTIAEKIAQALPDTRAMLKQEVLRTYATLFDWRSGYVMVLLGGAILAFFIFAWDRAAGLSAEERAEIGTLKALGWDTSDVLAMKFWEGMALSLTSFVLGVLAAYVHVFWASAPVFQHALKGWAVLYPRFRLIPTVDAHQLAVLFFLSVLPYTLVTMVPTWRVAVTDPDAVMRQR